MRLYQLLLSPRFRRAVTVGAMGAVGALGAAGCAPPNADAGGDSTAFRVIQGGSFEASGAAHVPGTNTVLFVDDGRTREIFLMELTSEGTQRGSARPIALGADVTDLEGITADGRHFYVVGSQSKRTGFDGDGLVRFAFDPATRRVDRVERIQGLKAWLAANVSELRGTERRLGDEVLNIEALAWDPGGRRLLLGLRAPVVDGQALIIPITLADSTAGFTRENLRADGAAIRVNLGGAGIRGLEYDGHTQSFRLITGSGVNDENRDFRVMEWDGTGGSSPREIASYSRRLKPEGIARVTLDGRPATIIVFDVGRFLVTD